MAYVSGENRNQIILLPDSIDDYVVADNAVRVIDAYVDGLDMEGLGFTKTKPKNTGRPPYSPQDLLKLYIYGYMNRVRSSRRLETETKRNLEVIWLMRKLSPDHKTIARFRHDNGTALKNVFRDFVKLCIKLELYGKELVAIDGSKFKAVNSKDRNFTGAKLKERLARLDAKIEEYMLQADKADRLENEVDNISKSSNDAKSNTKSHGSKIADIITQLSQRKELYQSYADELSSGDETQKSLTDPDSHLMMSNGKMDVCYNVQSSVDGKNKMIVHFDVINNAQDHNQLSPMTATSAEILEVPSIDACADKGYGSASDIVTCIAQGITPHVAGVDYDVCLPANLQVPEGLSSIEVAAENCLFHL